MKFHKITLLLFLIQANLFCFEETDTSEDKMEYFPIILYDSDVGYGMGHKIFWMNPFQMNESFDAILLVSSKGEEYVRFVFSLPDFNYRQGKVYDYSFDLIIDYDIWLNSSFFGIGNESKFVDRERYTKAPLDISLVFSRGFTKSIVSQVGLRYRSVNNYGFQENSILKSMEPELNSGMTRAFSTFINLRFDTRDDYRDPKNGFIAMAEYELVPKIGSNNVNYNKIAFDIQFYQKIELIESVFAARLRFDSFIGNELPIQAMLPIGGNRTLRGAVQDRFLDNTSGTFNAELRFPIVGFLGYELGGIAGYDCGRVWDIKRKMELSDLHTAPVIGLRYYVDNIIARLDVGFGKESTGVYFNFGHMF